MIVHMNTCSPSSLAVCLRSAMFVKLLACISRGDCKPMLDALRCLQHTKGQAQEAAIETRNTPPAVVLAAELEVAQYYCDLCACDDQYHKDQAQEAEEVVELVEPHGGEDEEELDEDCAERQNASNQDAKHRVHVPWLLRYLPGNLVGAHWVLECRRLVAKVRAHEDQRH